METVIINGLDIEAVNSEGKKVTYFEIIKIDGMYYGVHNIESTDREYLQLKVVSKNIHQPVE